MAGKNLKTGKTNIGTNPKTNPVHSYPDAGNKSDMGARGSGGRGSSESGKGRAQGKGTSAKSY